MGVVVVVVMVVWVGLERGGGVETFTIPPAHLYVRAPGVGPGRGVSSHPHLPQYSLTHARTHILIHTNARAHIHTQRVT